MTVQRTDQLLELLVFESSATSMLALLNAFSYWMSETVPNTLTQRHEHTVQTTYNICQQADTFIRQACDDQGTCTMAGYFRRTYAPDRAATPAIGAQVLTQSILQNLRQQSRETALDYLAVLIGGWCLACPIPLAQRYLIDAQNPTDMGLAQSLLAWTFRPLDFWN